MGRPKGGDRVRGPYREVTPGGQERWRVQIIVVDLKGQETKQCSSFPTEEEALEFKRGAEEARRGAVTLTIGQAKERFLAQSKSAGNKDRSVQALEHQLLAYFLGQEELPLAALLRQERLENKPVTLAARLYQDLTTRSSRTTKPYAVATHRASLRAARRFLRWCVAEGWLPSNPLEEVQGKGAPNAGKDQLGLDEARAWTAKALELARSEDVAAVAALTVMLLGLRQSEATWRKVGDIDNRTGPGALVFRVRDAKTKKGIRDSEIPAVLEPFIRRLLEGRRPDEFLFGCVQRHGQPEPAGARRFTTATKASRALAAQEGHTLGVGGTIRDAEGTVLASQWTRYARAAAARGDLVEEPDGWRVAKAPPAVAPPHRCTPHSANWVRNNVARICRLAGVKRVCAHAMRGLHTTLAVRQGVTPHVVADAVGHTSYGMTARHYVAPGTLEAVQQERLAGLVAAPAQRPTDEVAQLREQVAALQAQLAQLPPLPQITVAAAGGHASPGMTVSHYKPGRAQA